MPAACNIFSRVAKVRESGLYFFAARDFAAGHVAERLVDSPKLFGSRVIYADAVRATKLGQVLLILLARH